MRPRSNKNLVFTTSNDPDKISLAKRNRENQPKKIAFLGTVFGKTKKLTRDEYIRLKKAGLNVDIVEE